MLVKSKLSTPMQFITSERKINLLPNKEIEITEKEYNAIKDYVIILNEPEPEEVKDEVPFEDYAEENYEVDLDGRYSEENQKEEFMTEIDVDELNSKSKKDLKSLAEYYEIDTTNLTTKKKIIDKFKELKNS